MEKDTSQKKGFNNWKTRDIMVTCVIGIVFVIIMAGAMNLGMVLMGIITPPLAAMLVMPISVLTGVMALYIVRRPGAGLLSELVTSIVMAPFTAYGFTTIFSRLTEGLLYEAPFLITRYRKWGWLSLLILTGISGMVSFSMAMVHYGGFNFPPLLVIGFFAANFILCSVAGALAKLQGDSIAKTGVLNSFSIGQDQLTDI